MVAKALQRIFVQLKMFNDVKDDFLDGNFKGVVNNLSKDNKRLLKQLLTILDKVLEHKDTNKMNEPNLATVWTQAMLDMVNFDQAKKANEAFTNLLKQREQVLELL